MVAQSLVAGLVADFLRRSGSIRNPSASCAFRWFAVARADDVHRRVLARDVRVDGIWWDWNVALGAWIWAGVCGFALSLVVTARRTA